MKAVTIEKLSNEQIDSKGILTWPIWTKEVSSFPWQYGDKEQCLILEGEIIVKAEGEEYHINPGDFVTFASGLSCHWEILKPVKKHYNFG
jgi:uncharacterized protein